MRWRDFDSLTPLSPDFFARPRHVHFIGIGGIGMSALAFALRARGHAVSGSDASDSEMLARLRAVGVITAAGPHQVANLHLFAAGQRAEAVIFSSAITAANPEREAAATLGLPQWHRAQLLAYFVNGAQRSIAVSGTHGKSTTSAMIAHILTACGHNPTALLGAVYPPFGSNCRLGDPNLIVVEADESDGSFTLLHPGIAVITNVEAEHLENYDHSEEELWRAFSQFARQTQASCVVLNADDEELCRRLAYAEDSLDRLNLTFGEDGLVQVKNIMVRDGQTQFELSSRGQEFGPFALGVPGHHNVSNAAAALCAVWLEGVEPADAGPTLADFHGVGRRFERKGEANGIVVYDDYGHHPTEVGSTLQAANEFLGRPLLVIFQPHRYSRTQQLGKDFGPVFGAADRVIITQLYSAFEEPIEGISGRIVFDAVRQSFPDKPVFYAENLDEARQLAVQLARPGDAILTMGAGDISKLGPLLLEDLGQPESGR